MEWVDCSVSRACAYTSFSKIQLEAPRMEVHWHLPVNTCETLSFSKANKKSHYWIYGCFSRRQSVKTKSLKCMWSMCKTLHMTHLEMFPKTVPLQWRGYYYMLYSSLTVFKVVVDRKRVSHVFCEFLRLYCNANIKKTSTIEERNM